MEKEYTKEEKIQEIKTLFNSLDLIDKLELLKEFNLENFN